MCTYSLRLRRFVSSVFSVWNDNIMLIHFYASSFINSQLIWRSCSSAYENVFDAISVCGTVFLVTNTVREKPFCDVTNILMNIFRYVIVDSVLGFCDNSQTSTQRLRYTQRHSLKKQFFFRFFLSFKFRGDGRALIFKAEFSNSLLLSHR